MWDNSLNYLFCLIWCFVWFRMYSMQETWHELDTWQTVERLKSKQHVPFFQCVLRRRSWYTQVIRGIPLPWRYAVEVGSNGGRSMHEEKETKMKQKSLLKHFGHGLLSRSIGRRSGATGGNKRARLVAASGRETVETIIYLLDTKCFLKFVGCRRMSESNGVIYGILCRSTKNVINYSVWFGHPSSYNAPRRYHSEPNPLDKDRDRDRAYSLS
jgi:hypothetical protein